MEISSKYINEIIQDNASILGNLNKSIRDFKEYCSSSENEEIFKNDVSKFAYQVLINRWTQYHYSRIMYPESPKYNENLRTFMKEIIHLTCIMEVLVEIYYNQAGCTHMEV